MNHHSQSSQKKQSNGAGNPVKATDGGEGNKGESAKDNTNRQH